MATKSKSKAKSNGQSPGALRRRKLASPPDVQALPKLELACGQNKREGWEGTDIAEVPGVDHVVDLLSFPWPFEDEHYGELAVSHFVEHIPLGAVGHEEPFFQFFGECWRILAPGGVMTVIAPYYSSMRAWQDPTHRRAISEASFLYLNKPWREQNRLDHYPIDAQVDFDFSYGYAMTPDWAMRNEETRAFAIRHYLNVVNDIHVTLTKMTER
jgi:predicted SAM-dependent methyltransferase